MHVCVGNPLQYSHLENPMDRGAWQAAVPRVVENQTQLKQLSTHASVCTQVCVIKALIGALTVADLCWTFQPQFVVLPSSPCKGGIIGHVLGQWRMTWRLERWPLGDLSWAPGCPALTPVLPFPSSMKKAKPSERR